MESDLTIAMVFPGQGSQSPGMQADLATEYEFVQQTYAEASEILGYDLWQLVQEGPAERLGETVVTQPAMLTAGYVSWLAWQEAGGAGYLFRGPDSFSQDLESSKQKNGRVFNFNFHKSASMP